jgi:hypothetical protein
MKKPASIIGAVAAAILFCGADTGYNVQPTNHLPNPCQTRPFWGATPI